MLYEDFMFVRFEMTTADVVQTVAGSELHCVPSGAVFDNADINSY